MTKEDKTGKRKRRRRRFKILIFLILIIAYAMTIGTKGIFTKDIVIKSKEVTNGINGAKIVQFSDLKYNSKTKKSDIRNLVKEINKANADIVVFTGDLINKKYDIKKNEIEMLKNELGKINARCGKIYILGNEDNDDTKNILEASFFDDASNTEQIIYFNKASISFIGIAGIDEYINAEHSSNFKILLLHNPNDIKKIGDYDFNLAMAGHTLNGQINIPKIKNLLISGKYINEKNKYNNTTMYINPGIGKGSLRVRLFNHPTIYLYRLKSA